MPLGVQRMTTKIEGIWSEYLQFARFQAFSLVLFDLIQPTNSTPLIHSFVVKDSDSAWRLAAFFVQHSVS